MVDKILLHYLFREISRYLFVRDIRRYRELMIFENEINIKKNVTQSVKKFQRFVKCFYTYKFHKYICYYNCNNNPFA